MSPTLFLLIFLAGALGGLLSAVAGGASFVTFPVLLFAGLPPLVANTTNFVALMLAQPTALVTSYRSELLAVRHSLLPSLVSALVGGAAGAGLLLLSGEAAFKVIIPYLMLLATAMFALGPRVRAWSLAGGRSGWTAASLPCQGLMLLFSAYCGYFGAGVGMMLLAVLSVFGYDDVHEANAVKNAVVMVSSLVATLIYGLSGAVDWPVALTMMAGATAGAWAGGVLAKRLPADRLRTGLVGLGLVFTVYLFLR